MGMGRWLKELLQGGKKKRRKKKKQEEEEELKERRRWGFAKPPPPRPYGRVPVPVPAKMEEMEQSKRAIVVAAATAAVAEAAVAAAQAAAAVVRLTSSGRGIGFFESAAATRIQTAFRAYLARRALRALKGLVKLQALVRGHIVRKQAAETLRCMQALVRVQARARAGRVLSSDPSFPRLAAKSGKRMEQWPGHERYDRVLEMDAGRQRGNTRRRATMATATATLSSSSVASDQNSRSFATSAQISIQSPSSVDMPLQLSPSALTTDEKVGQSPRIYATATSAALSDCSSGFFSTYSDHPSYMACTKSSRAKVRSQSAPRQRPDQERPASSHRAHAKLSMSSSSLSVSSSVQSKFTNKAYSNSGRLDRLGLPVRY